VSQHKQEMERRFEVERQVYPGKGEGHNKVLLGARAFGLAGVPRKTGEKKGGCPVLSGGTKNEQK